MPIYEYECQKCGHYLEALQKIADKPLRECPECGKHALKRLVSAPMFRLSGSGWYETDFKSDQERKRNPAGERDESTSASKEAAKSETKTDAKADAKSDTKDTKPETKGSDKPAAESRSTRSRAVVPKPALASKPARPAAKSAIRSKKKAKR
jgi:putative FmdB family regulatory protein